MKKQNLLWNKIKEFPYTTAYLILLSSVTLVVWQNHWENYGVVAVLALMLLFFIVMKDTMPTVALLLNGLFMVSQTNWSFAEAPLYLYLTPIVIIGGMIIHIIIYKVNIFRGKMLLGIGIMILAMLLSTINAEVVNIYYLFYISIGFLYALIYMFYRNTFQKDHVQYLIKLLFILGILISFQVLLFYLGVEDIRASLEQKTLNLGWGLSNYVATYLIMFIPTTLYYARTSKWSPVLLLVAFFETAMIMFTGSRGGMVAFAVMVPFYAFFLLFKSPLWQKNMFYIGLLLEAVFFTIYINYDFVSSVFLRFENLLFDDTGRFEIYQNAIAVFREHPLFGGGIFARTGDSDYTMFHNTILHTFATMGIIGGVGLGVQLFQQFKITLGKREVVNFLMALALLGANIHGMVDNIYYMPQFMVILVIITSICEKRMLVKEVMNIKT